MKSRVCVATFIGLVLGAGLASAQVVAYDMVGSASQNLTSYTNAWTGAFTSAGDGFQKYQRGVSASIPFAVLDDSLSIFPGDTLGIIKDGNTDVFFGVTDTENGDNSGPVSATWTFDVSGATGLVLSIAMGAMGDFESTDSFEWTYSIDGGPTLVAFANAVDEAGSYTYVLEGGASFTLNDPMLVQGTILSDDLATFSTPLVGTGSSLTLTLTAQTDGGSEAFAFQNLVVSQGGLPTAAVAYDMVVSTALNLTTYSNAWTGAFTSAGDGFQKYQRGVSPSIPFSVLDDSLSIFPGDILGIVKDGNTDVFFGVTDTENGDNSGPVSATWTFDVSGASSGLVLSIAMGAMGDFESADSFEWTYSIDGGPTLVAFANAVDEAGSYTYVLEGGASFTLNDPMLVHGTILTDDLATFSTPLVGTGSTLTLTLTAQTDGGSEAFAFQNVVLSDADVPPPPTVLEVFQIQGSGLASPYAGQVVTTNDNIVTALASNGFFIQTPDARADADAETSNGLFVFTNSAPTVSAGDQVDVTGTVQEFFDFTELSGSPIVSVDSSSNPLPAVVTLDATNPTPNQPQPATAFERYEGMRVQVTGGRVTGPNQYFGSDPIAEVFVTAGPNRTLREIGIEYPGLPGLPVWDGNPEVFELDADRLGLSNDIIPAGSTFSATGVLGYEFGGYELWPASLSVTAAPLPVPVRARAAGEMTVGSLNMLRLFDDVDDPYSADDGSTPSAADYALRLRKLSLYVRTVLGAPDVLGVQEVENLNALQDLAAQIASDDASVVYSAYLVEGNDVGGIDVGYLVRSSVAVDAVTQLGAAELLTYDNSLLHDRPPLLLEGRYQGNGLDFPIAVLVVHMRSLLDIDDPTDGPRVRQKRLEQAQSVAQMVQTLQTGDPTIHLAVIGDFNAYEFTDGYVDLVGQTKGSFVPADNLLSGPDLVDPDLTDEVLSLPAAERYSYIYRGTGEVLDHALTAAGLGTFVRGLAFGRGNVDAAVWYEDQDLTPLRCSDHDGLVLFLMTDADGDGVPDDAPAFTVHQLVAARAEGRVTDDTGIVSLVLLGGSVNVTLTTAGASGDPSWTWEVRSVDLLQPATAILLATDEDGRTTTLVLDLEARDSIVIPALGGAGLALLSLLLAAAGALFLRRCG